MGKLKEGATAVGWGIAGILKYVGMLLIVPVAALLLMGVFGNQTGLVLTIAFLGACGYFMWKGYKGRL